MYFSSCNSCVLKVKLWWVGARERKKSAYFVIFILSKWNFFDVSSLSQCVVYWINFQNIYTLAYQKTLLHTLLMIVFKIVKSFQCILKRSIFVAVFKHLLWFYLIFFIITLLALMKIEIYIYIERERERERKRERDTHTHIYTVFPLTSNPGTQKRWRQHLKESGAYFEAGRYVLIPSSYKSNTKIFSPGSQYKYIKNTITTGKAQNS